MKIIGYRKSDFVAPDGSKVCGYWFYLAAPLRGDGCVGSYCEKVYISEAKLKGRPLPEIGASVDVYYNKKGKVSQIFY